MYNHTIDDLEIEYGTTILSELCGHSLTRNQQPVRLFDQTRHSSEFYFRADIQTGKPYIQDFQNGKRYYPVTAYSQAYGLEFATAKSELLKRYYTDLRSKILPHRPRQFDQPTPRPVDYIPAEYYERCQNQFECNGLYEYLRFKYGHKYADEVFTHYRLGTSRRWRYLGYLATCLPQFDHGGNLRQVKIMVFDAMNGRRVKKHQQAEKWNYSYKQYEWTLPDADKSYFAGKQLATEAGMTDVNLQQCFFGEHLLTEHPNQPVAIVEGESTAIVCSILWPQFIWLGSGGSTGGCWYSRERFSVLRKHHVTLWPDTDKHEEWRQRAELLRSQVQSLNVSEYVKTNIPEGMSKADLRDLLSRPCYFPKDSDQVIYGEALNVEINDTYPIEWDNANLPEAIPTIIASSPKQYLNLHSE